MRGELHDTYPPPGEPCDDIEFPPKRGDDPFERTDLHIGLIFKFGEARLADTEGGGDFALAFARESADFAQEKLAEQFAGALAREHARAACGRSFHEIVK